MKHGKKRLVGMALFVLVASFVLVGGVAADHLPAPVYAGNSSLDRFDVYMWASSWSERAAEHSESASPSMTSLERFEAYTLGMAWEPETTEADSWTRFETYLRGSQGTN